MEILCGILWAIISLINPPILNNFSHQLQVDINTLICYRHFSPMEDHSISYKNIPPDNSTKKLSIMP